VPPVLVYLAAETGPILRDRLTEAVLRAARPVNATSTVPDTPADAAPGTVPAKRKATRKAPAKPRRKLLADYLTEARDAYVLGVEVTPAWVRQVSPKISRGTSKNVADRLMEELAARATANDLVAPVDATPATDERRAA